MYVCIFSFKCNLVDSFISYFYADAASKKKPCMEIILCVI